MEAEQKNELTDQLITPEIFAATTGKAMGMSYRQAVRWFKLPDSPTFKVGRRYFAWESDILKWGR